MRPMRTVKPAVKFRYAAQFAMFLLLAGLLTYGCRENRIDDCRDKGGTPVVPAWFSEEPADVRCIID